jgi:hypothetical protein
MPEKNPNTKQIYGLLSQQFQMPEFDEFRRGLRAPENRLQAYELLSQRFEMPDIEEFSKGILSEVKPSLGERFFIEGAFKSSSIGALFGAEEPPEEIPEDLAGELAKGAGEIAGDIPIGAVTGAGLGLAGAKLGGAIGTLIAPGPGTAIGAGTGYLLGQGAGFLVGPELVKQLTGRKEKDIGELSKLAAIGGLSAGIGRIAQPLGKPLGKFGERGARLLGESTGFIGAESAIEGQPPTPEQIGIGLAFPVALEASGALGRKAGKAISEKFRPVTQRPIPPHVGTKEGLEISGSPIGILQEEQLINPEFLAKAREIAVGNPYVTQTLIRTELEVSEGMSKRILNQLESEGFIKPPDKAGRRFTVQDPPPVSPHRAADEIGELGNEGRTPEGHRLSKFWRYILRPERATAENKGLFRGGRAVEVDITNPKAQDISSKIIGTQLYISQRKSDADRIFDRAKQGLSKDEQLLVGRASELAGKTDQTSLDKFNKYPDSVKNSAKIIRSWFDSIKEDIRDAYRHRLLRDLAPSQRSAYLEATAQRAPNIGEIALRHRVDPEWLKGEWGKYRDIDLWGIEDFVTKIEIGAYKIIDKTGQVRAVAETRRDAMKKLKEIRERFPTMEFSDRPIVTEYSDPINPLARRKDILLGEKDIFKALPAYTAAVYKRIILEPVEYDVRRYMENNPKLFTPTVKAVIEDQLAYARGTKSFGDRITDDLAFRMGIKPDLWSRFVSTSNKITSRLLLGWRLPNYLVNLYSGMAKTLIKTSPKWAKRAVEYMDTPEGKKFLAEEERLGSLALDVRLGLEGEALSTAKWYDPLKIYSLAEPPNRKFGLVVPYLYARDGLKMTDAAAREYARRTLRLTNLSYNTAALPGFLRSPSGKFFGQFKSYLAGEIEFIHSLTPAELAQYTLAQFLATGARGFILFAKSLPILGAMGFLDKLEEGINQLGDFWSRGIPGMMGFDIAPQATIQLAPGRIEDAAGPFVGNMARLYQQTLGSLENTEGRIENAIEWAYQLPTIMKSWNDILSSVISDDGWIYRKDRDGKVSKVWRPDSDWDRLLLALDFNPIEKSKTQTALQIWKEEDRKHQANQRAMRNRLVRKLVGQDKLVNRLGHRMLRENLEGLPNDFIQSAVSYLAVNDQLTDEEIKDAAALGLTAQGLSQAVRNAKTDPQVREIMRAELIRKGRALELLQLD